MDHKDLLNYAMDCLGTNEMFSDLFNHGNDSKLMKNRNGISINHFLRFKDILVK